MIAFKVISFTNSLKFHLDLCSFKCSLTSSLISLMPDVIGFHMSFVNNVVGAILWCFFQHASFSTYIFAKLQKHTCTFD